MVQESETAGVAGGQGFFEDNEPDGRGTPQTCPSFQDGTKRALNVFCFFSLSVFLKSVRFRVFCDGESKKDLPRIFLAVLARRGNSLLLPREDKRIVVNRVRGRYIPPCVVEWIFKFYLVRREPTSCVEWWR